MINTQKNLNSDAQQRKQINVREKNKLEKLNKWSYSLTFSKIVIFKVIAYALKGKQTSVQNPNLAQNDKFHALGTHVTAHLVCSDVQHWVENEILDVI